MDKVWELLIDFDRWKEWNSQIEWVEIEEVKEEASFKWKINGSKISSTISRITENEILSWTGTFMGLKAIHVWKLDATDGNQTIVTCEESMQGLLTLFLGHRTLHETLLKWLEALKAEAEK